jgi:hypothetical protein
MLVFALISLFAAMSLVDRCVVVDRSIQLMAITQAIYSYIGVV